MNVYPLVFSNNPRYRVSRHVLFWLLWILYFTFMYTFGRLEQHSFGTAFSSALVEILIYTPIDMVHCYLIIYFLLPRFLFRGRYGTFILLWLGITLLTVGMSRLVMLSIVAPVRESFAMSRPVPLRNFFVFFYDNFAFYNMQGCLAAAIKLGKMAFVNKQELSLVKTEKQRLDARAEAGMMQPVFLLNALESIRDLSGKKPAAIPAMVSKIKNLLLYAIYDHNQRRVPLRKELDLLEEYLELEKTADPNLHPRLSVRGEVGEERIAPFILLPLAEHSFRQLDSLAMKEKIMEVSISIEEGWMTMNLSWNKPTDTAALSNGINGFLHTIRKRLDLLYPESHEMKVVIESERFNVSLKVDLRRGIN